MTSNDYSIRENIVNIAMRAAELLMDGKIERDDISGHTGMTHTIIELAERFEREHEGVDYDAEGRDYWLEIDDFAEKELMQQYGREISDPLPEFTDVPSFPVKVYAVSGYVRHEVFSGDWDECAAFCADHNGCFLDENEFEWSLEIEDEREDSFPDGFFDAVDHYCELAGSDIENEFVRQHAEELTYCWENGLFLMDFEMWTGLEAVLNERLTFEEASFLKGASNGKAQDLSSNEITASLDKLQSALADFRSGAGKRPSLDSQINNAAQKAGGEPCGPRNLNEIHQTLGQGRD